MKSLVSTGLILALNLSICFAAKRSPVPVWTNAEFATREVEHFPMVGEYLSNSGSSAIQATLLKDGDFLVATYQNGLPGAGWDQSAIKSDKLNPEALKALLKGYTKTERTSPTMGKSAPANAILTFPSDLTNVSDGLLLAGGKTAKDLGSFHMHLEFMQPFKPGRNPSNQDRGNSGIYIFDNYEIQIIDTFALDLDTGNNAIATESANTQWCGALYKMKRPDVHMAYPPLRWQTFDIDFQAPEIDGGKKVRNARITVVHNGIKIHDNIELKTGTGAGAKRKQLAQGPIYFQDHKNPIIFRNIWATELTSEK